MISPAKQPLAFVTRMHLLAQHVCLEVHLQIVSLIKFSGTNITAVWLPEGAFQLFASRFRIDNDRPGELLGLEVTAVYALLVQFQLLWSFEELLAGFTSSWLIFRRSWFVRFQVQIEPVNRGERATTNVAAIDLHWVFVACCVCFEVFQGDELPRTANALETLLFGVNRHVSFQMMVIVEPFRANFTGKVPLPSMALLVGFHVG